MLPPMRRVPLARPARRVQFAGLFSGARCLFLARAITKSWVRHCLPSSQVRRVNSSVQSHQQPAQKGSAMSHDRRKLLGKKQLPRSSKPKTSPTSAVYSDHHKKTGGVKRKISEEEKVRQIVRDMFNYNPEKYADDRNMEAGYASIQLEEIRSVKLAIKEYDEKLQMIKEEKRRKQANTKKKQWAQS